MLIESPNRHSETPVTTMRVRVPVQTDSSLFSGWGIRF
jgi:hypothetical protein